uniref:Uncharacterized protein n=1 Tax=viral metagenome TaxID=1070528 RepID=A0A6C0JSG9_9ZZZZ
MAFTSLTLNSLQRLNEDDAACPISPNPFEFTISAKQTSNWIFKRKIFSRVGNTKVTDAFDMTVCNVFIPKALVPIQPTQLFLQITVGGIQVLDKQIGPHIKSASFLSGYTGPCLPYPDELPNYNGTWPLIPFSPKETPDSWTYSSCGHVSYNTDWKGLPVTVRIRDSQGYTLEPGDGLFTGPTGMTGSLCDFQILQNVITGPTGSCNPCACDPQWVKKYLSYNKGTYSPPFIDPQYQPLFQPQNQVIVILNCQYLEQYADGVGLQECFTDKR